MAEYPKWVNGLLAVILLISGVGTVIYFNTDIVAKDLCGPRGDSEPWENVTSTAYYNKTLSAIGRYYCEKDATISKEECVLLDKLLNVNGCKWCARLSGTGKTCYVIVDDPEPEPESEITLSLFKDSTSIAIDVGLDKSEGIKMDLVYDGISRKVLEFEIENDISAQEIQIFVSETNFDIMLVDSGKLEKFNSGYNVVPIDVEVCSPYYEWHEGNQTEVEISNCTMIEDGTEQVYYEGWDPVALVSSDKSKADRLDKFNILSKGKYRYTFNVPIVKTNDGWGSSGTVYLGVDDEVYVDKQHSSWWDGSWGNRKNVIFTGGEVELVNFTVFLNITYEASMQSGFDDVRFLNGSCTNNSAGSWEDYFEFDNIFNSSSAGVWVLVPRLITGVNELCMYYGNSGASMGEQPTKTWDSNYAGIFHFSEGTGTGTKESISGVMSGFSGSPPWTTGSACTFGSCLNLQGNDCVHVENAGNVYDTVSVTAEVWMFPSSPWLGRGPMKRYDTGAWDPPYATWQIQLGSIGIGTTFATSDTYRDMDYSHAGVQKLFVAFSYDATSGDAYQIQNKTTIDYFSSSGDLSLGAAGVNLSFGCRDPDDTPTDFFNGTMDEIRISKIQRNTGWLNRTYENSNISTYVFGSEEISNLVPIITADINETIVYNWTSVNASATYTDANSDVGTVYFNLTINYVHKWGKGTTSVSNGSSVSIIVDSANWTTLDNVSFKFTAYDGTAYTVNSTNTTIVNIAPISRDFTRTADYIFNMTTDVNISAIYTDGDLLTDGTCYFNISKEGIHQFGWGISNLQNASSCSYVIDKSNFTTLNVNWTANLTMWDGFNYTIGNVTSWFVQLYQKVGVAATNRFVIRAGGGAL